MAGAGPHGRNSKAPGCKTAEPWNDGEACCPSACVQEYKASGVSGDEDAFLSVFIRLDGNKQMCLPQFDVWMKGDWK
jgi:hypothetical protein